MYFFRFDSAPPIFCLDLPAYCLSFVYLKGENIHSELPLQISQTDAWENFF